MKKKVALALQGGGAHGAFTWGVIERLLDEEDLEIVGVSGTSAGGMNAACTVQGLIQGGPKRAKELLFEYWSSISKLGKKISPVQQSAYDSAVGLYNLDHTLPFKFFSGVKSTFSPYEINPFNINPFFDFLKEFFDFKTIRESKYYKIFLGTTNVKSGKIRIFSNSDFCADVLLASACLPSLFQAVLVDGEYYWDGGYIANPAIYPLINQTESSDIILVQLSKLKTNTVPKTALEIQDRIKEITFNNCLIREMRAIHFVTELIEKGIVQEGALKKINMHLIQYSEFFEKLNISSASNTDFGFLTLLRKEGNEAASNWLKDHKNDIGAKRTMDEAIFDLFM